MKTIPAAVQTALDAETMGFSIIVKLTLKNATVLAFTSNDEPILHDGTTYLPGLSEGKFPQMDGLAPASQKGDFLIDSDSIVIADMEAGLYDDAVIEAWAIQHAAPLDGVVEGIKGKLGKVTTGDTLATAEMRGLRDELRTAIGRSFTKACPWDLGDADCQVVLSGFTVTGTLTGVTDDRVFADSGRGEADDHFNLGLLTWTTGNNTGLAMEVKDFANATGEFTLILPMPNTVQVGDAYSVYQGCDKTDAVCIATFSNIENYGGTPFIPGQTQHMKTARQ